MNKERSREIKRAAVATSRLPPTRRQQKSLSSAHLNSKEQHHLSEQLMVVDKWNKEKAPKESKAGGSEDCATSGGGGSDGNDELRPPLTTVAASATCSRKRVKLIRKFSGDYRSVDSAVVPRKLRSAINKRSGDSPSPRMLNGKRKCSDVPSTNEEANDLLTKEEEEVAEILIALAAMVMSNGSIKSTTDDCKMPGDDADADADAKRSNLAALSEEVVDAGLLPGEASMTKSTEADLLKQNAHGVLPGSGKPELDVNGTTEEAAHRSPLFTTRDSCLIPSDASKLACLVDAPSDVSSPYGAKQPTHIDSSSLPNHVQSIAASSSDDMKSVSVQKVPCSTIREDINLETQKASATVISNDKHLMGAFSTDVVLGSNASARSCPTNDRWIQKPLLFSTNGRHWKKCVTHVYISHLIQNYQNSKQRKDISSQDHLKSKEPTNLATEDFAKIGPSSSSSMAMPSTVEVPQNRRLVDAQQPQNTPVIHFHRKQTHDFLSLSSVGETSSPGNKTELPGKLPLAYLHSLPPPHSSVLLSSSRGHYSSYPEYSRAATHKQVHMQLPPQYVSPAFYASHQGNMIMHPLQQQQQMWQAHAGQYRMSSLRPAKWPGSKQQDASLSSIPSAQMQHVAAGSPSLDLRGVVGHGPLVPLQHQVLPIQLHASNQSK